MTLGELNLAVSNSKKILHLLQLKFPKLKCYLVFSTRFGQALLSDSNQEILRSFPQFFIDNDTKQQILNHFREFAAWRLANRWRKNSEGPKYPKHLEDHLNVDDDVRIEIRFDSLDFDLIRQMQTDPLIDMELTPRTRASIQIVLGTLKALATKNLNNSPTRGSHVQSRTLQ